MEAYQPQSRAVFRMMLSGIFIVSGLGHLMKPGPMAQRLEAAPMGGLATWMASADTLILLSGVALLAGGLALLVGFKTRLAALGLIALLIPITVTVQIAPEAMGPLFKNVGLAGGLLFFVTHGADAWSWDSARAAKGERASQPVAGQPAVGQPAVGQSLTE